MAVGMFVVVNNSVPSAHPVNNSAGLMVAGFAQLTRRSPSDLLQELLVVVVLEVDLGQLLAVRLLQQACLPGLQIELAFRSSSILVGPGIAVG